MMIKASQLKRRILVAAMAVMAVVAAPAVLAQGIERIDPDMAIDADLEAPQPAAGSRYDSAPPPPPAQTGGEIAPRYSGQELDLPPETAAAGGQGWAPPAASAAADTSDTYAQDDLIGAAEGLFGKGAEGMARVIEGILRDQGEPNGYIVGREGGGAFVLGVRYGSGTLFHKVEGERQVYWTGPSIGFDAGANAGNTFVLVYNLHDSEDLFSRFPAGEGQAYLIGGFHASYMRRGNIVLIPIRVGAGLRLGVNAGYMRFSKRQRWVPF